MQKYFFVVNFLSYDVLHRYHYLLYKALCKNRHAWLISYNLFFIVATWREITPGGSSQENRKSRKISSPTAAGVSSGSQSFPSKYRYPQIIWVLLLLLCFCWTWSDWNKDSLDNVTLRIDILPRICGKHLLDCFKFSCNDTPAIVWRFRMIIELSCRVVCVLVNKINFFFQVFRALS